MPNVAPELHVEQLVLDAPDRSRQLLDIEALNVSSGSFLAIAGPSGAGKSSLLFVLSALIGHSHGIVRWGETDLSRLNAAARTRFRARSCGFAFQDARLIEEQSAFANAAQCADWAPARSRTRIETRAQSQLVRLGLDPDDTRPVASYSGGERQRIVLARALATDPPLLFADEPTASLDRLAADKLVELLRSLADEGGKTLCVVTHDPTLISAADRLIILQDGRLIDDVTHD